MPTQLRQAFIIDSNYIKTQYPGYCDSSVDSNSLESFILMAQDISIQSLIGYTMLFHIIDNLIIDPSGSTLSTQYQYILVNYIQKSTALWAIYQAYPSLLYKATNKAVVTKHSEDSVAVGIREMEYMRSQIRNNAEFYDSRTLEYIKNNSNYFIEYYTTSGVNRVRPKSTVYFGGLYLGNNGRLGNKGCDGPSQNLNW